MPDSPTPPPVYVKAKELAAPYKISPATVRAWYRQGKLPAVKFAGTVRFNLDACKALIEGGLK